MGNLEGAGGKGTVVNFQLEVRMRVYKAESVHNIFKLIDACKQCRQIFNASSVGCCEPACKELTEKIRRKLDQFGIELRNEVRQLDRKLLMSFIEDFGAFRFEPISAKSETLALQQLLDWYDQALKRPLSIETRANRQTTSRPATVLRTIRHLESSRLRACSGGECGRIPLLVRRGGCGINKKSRSQRSAADGVVAHTPWFK